MIGSQDRYDSILADNRPVSPEELKSVLATLIPKPSGHPLIRLGGVGPKGGGYLVPDDMDGIVACFSPGNDNMKRFEDDLAKLKGIRSFLCDYSSDYERFATPFIPGKQQFEKKWLEPEPGPDNLDINAWVRAHGGESGDLLLEMDIEGAEYRNLLHLEDALLARFRILILEFHSLFYLSDPQFVRGVLAPVLAKLDKDFICVHAHANNYAGRSYQFGDIQVTDCLEVAFLRRDRVKPDESPLCLPHPLDENCMPHMRPIHLTGLWRENADPISSEIVSLRKDVQWLVDKECQAKAREAGVRQSADLLAFMLAADKRLSNIALGKPVSVSSRSRTPLPEGRKGVTDGMRTGAWGVETERTPAPWCLVDLGQVHPLEALLVFNCLERDSNHVNTLKVKLSCDGVNWECIHDQRGTYPFGGIRAFGGMPPLFVALQGFKARYVRLELSGLTSLILDQIEIYAKTS